MQPPEIIESTEIDAVAVVTPVWTHFDLAKAALENGKHVFVEKPFTSTSQQAEELIELAERKNLKIMVDHTFLFSGAVRKIRELVDNGSLGRLYYFDSTRVNLGLFQHDVSVVWDLAPHDLSVMDYIIVEKPEAVVATGATRDTAQALGAYVNLLAPRARVVALRDDGAAIVPALAAGGFDRLLVTCAGALDPALPRDAAGLFAWDGGRWQLRATLAPDLRPGALFGERRAGELFGCS